MRRYSLVLAIALLAACTGTDGTTITPDVAPPQDGVSEDRTGDPDLTEGPDLEAPDLTQMDQEPGLDTIGGEDGMEPACEPGEGCFLDPCDGNDDCQSGWCVGHMGEDVCTLQCQTECPQGWDCQQVPGTAPDFVWVCLSPYANLCLPCSVGADCKGAAGADDVCVDYGPEGSFCGGQCEADEDCPWGFSCLDTQTVDGVDTRQCVADAGVCPCTEKSVDLALFTPCEVENEAGICGGKRICTDEGLSDCDAAEPSDELCDGLDNDCDGDTDEPLEVGGNYVNLCDDDNPCTEDTCDGADGCGHVALDSGECVDGDACSVGDHCEDGVCTGLPIVCDDDDPCTDDSCDGLGGCQATFNQAPCDDEDPCTVADTCSEGACLGYPVDCQCETDADCAALEDGDLCNGTLICDTDGLPYQCVVDPGTLVVCPEPVDGDICTETVCDATTGGCLTQAAHEGYACDDDDACSVGDQCQGGGCVPGVDLTCADGNPCTDDSCDPATGCQFIPNTGSCDDGDVCTTGDHCAGGLCIPGAGTPDCDDGNPCTADSCDPDAGCQHAPINAACTDGNACTTGDMCQGGFCVGGAALVCNDDNLCTDDSCDPVTGCVFALNQAPCNDGDLCTVDDHCHLGACIAGGALTCEDGNPCTDDSCEALSGCTFTPNAAACDDGNTCTENDHCAAGQCQGGTPTPCDDDNPCTDDYCDVSQGCIQVNNSDLCNDLDACTANEFCANGACGGGVPIVCQDDNPCTDDGCDSLTGCTFDPNTLPCTDGDACTDGDLCAEGDCVPGPALICDDSNLCTDDSCAMDSGCVFTPVVDGLVCEVDMHCEAGVCVTDCEVMPGTQTFNVTQTVVTFNVPECIEEITIEAWGGQGGKNVPCTQQGGKGARMKGTFTVTPGEPLKLVVGQRGKDRGSDTANQSGTGGGGSFVWRDAGDDLMIAAGGGGGGAICTSGGSPSYATGKDGVTATCGTFETTNSNPGGCDGASGTGGECIGKGWDAVLLNPAGTGSGGDQGGYGGGGTVGNSHGGGGAGGYGGGGCKPYTGNPAAAGGGGGSFNGGSATEGNAGVKTGDGQIIISWGM